MLLHERPQRRRLRMRKVFCITAALLLAAISLGGLFWAPIWLGSIVIVPLTLLGISDMLQTRRAVLRNFPVIGHGRYLLEMVRPEINQYFVESNTDGTPFSRELRSVVYQRAKRELDTLPFGTQQNVYEEGYEWIEHSMQALRPVHEAPRVLIGDGNCERPYSAALLNISAMSYGALSANAITALNMGAALGGFAHNSGEGGLSPHHLKGGGDLIWQIGTGYFGCRDEQGRFAPDLFHERAVTEQVKMIEIKISQGAKPGHGGILPAAKLTPEIAEIRGVDLGQDIISPPSHSTFTTPMELLEFINQLRTLSGKPVGIKFCLGKPAEFLALCKAMRRTHIVPDYVAVDGGEGGTGAAPLEFSNSVGSPLSEGLVYVHNALVGFDLRDRVRVIASGKVATGFQMAARMAMGADLCYAARSMMLALGCIQARRCNSNDCPVGVATQNPALVAGLVVRPKAQRVCNYQAETVDSLLELLAAAGLSDPSQLGPGHIRRRIAGHQVKSYAELYPFLERGSLINLPVHDAYEHDWKQSVSSCF